MTGGRFFCVKENTKEPSLCVQGVVKVKVKYIGPDYVTFVKNKNYEVLAIEKGYYRLMSELGETYLLPPEVCEEIVGE